MRKIIFSALVAASFSRAFQLPFDISSLWWSNLEPPPPPDRVVVPPRSPRIAIIGAGAGGSSAAFWIAKAKERYGLDIAIDIYERNDYIGGRKLLNQKQFSATGLSSFEEALQYTRIITPNMSLWNLAHLS